MWAVGIIGGIVGFMWIRSRTQSSTTSKTQPGQPTFTQAQEVQDFQIFSSLTGAQQASDLNFLSEVAGLFAGGSTASSSSGTSSGGGSGTPTTPSPAPTGTTAPTTTSAPKAPGMGLVQTSQGEMVELGVVNQGQAYNVSGGAPVYFGNAQQLSQGWGQATPGSIIYTPQQYAGQVSATASPEFQDPLGTYV
jgi:hypothetical protein